MSRIYEQREGVIVGRDRSIRGYGGALGTAWLLLGAMAGCAGDGASAGADIQRGLVSSERYVEGASSRGEPDRPPAMVEGVAITWEQLRPGLIEAAGGALLEEAALDLLLAKRSRRLGVSVTEVDIERERELLAAQISNSSETPDAATTTLLIERLKASRGLGRSRYAALLRRTAMLRKLVERDVVVTNAAIAQAFETLHGERRLAKLITVDTLAEASNICDLLDQGASFAELAAERSTDSSAARGGVIEPISLADATYPAAIRTAIARIHKGERTPPVALERGFAVLLLDQTLPRDDATLEATREKIEARVRLQLERIRMDRLARELLERARVTVFDDGLRRSWRNRRTK